MLPANIVILIAIFTCLYVGMFAVVVWLFRERRRLARGKHDFDLIFNHSGLRILFKDDENRVLRLNEPAARFLGHTASDAVGKTGYELFPEVAKERHKEDLEAIRSGVPSVGEVKRMGLVDGVTLWGRADKIPYKDPDTGEDRVIVIANDVSDQVNAAIELRRTEERFNLAIEMTSIGTWDWDIQTGRLFWSPRMREILGLTDKLPSPTVEDFNARLHPEDVERVKAARGAHLQDRVPYQVEFRLRQATGDYAWVRARGQAMWDEEGNPMRMAGLLEDITQRVLLEQKLAYAAHHDGLTGLLNRTEFNERIERALNHAQSDDAFALLILDLDGFKDVNDTLGHAAGDDLLKAVAERLNGCAGQSDCVARLGGDEFAIFVSLAGKPEKVDALASRIIQEVGSAYEIDNTRTVVGVSVGIAIAPENGTDVETLMSKADVALYGAKKDGRGTYRFFDRKMETDAEDRFQLQTDLREALANDELDLYYQPLVELAGNSVTGFEALLRWRHRTRGLVAAAKFVPVAESIGLINKIGDWALVQACTEAASWPDDIRVAVNVSPIQFKGGLILLSVSRALAMSGLRPDRLELEIVESVLLEDTEESLKILHQLHNLGVRVSLDDFGTGYSSLSYLRKFPFDKIKIDASFIKDIDGENDDELGIVRTIVTIASKLGVPTTAEGVETEEQLRIVRAEGCTEMQGHLFSPARPANEIAEMFLGRPSARVPLAQRA